MNATFSHMQAIVERFERESARLARAQDENNHREIAFRTAQVTSAKKEIAGEVEFLAKRGIVVPAWMMPVEDDMGDDELLAALGVA